MRWIILLMVLGRLFFGNYLDEESISPQEECRLSSELQESSREELV